MKHGVYQGEVLHRRYAPVTVRFRYAVYFFAVDLDGLDVLDREVAGFGVNRFAVSALHEKDFLREESGSIRQKLDRVLAEFSDIQPPVRVTLVTSARYFNYVFNPVSFYLLRDSADAIYALVAEVNNTFGDRHLYICSQLERDEQGVLHGNADKAFHVSPFFDMEGIYRFRIHEEGNRLTLDVNLERDGAAAFDARITGAGKPLTSAALRSVLIRYPFAAALTMPRIMAQAAKLHFQKKLPVYRRPEPVSPMTIKTRPMRFRDRFFRTRVHRVFGRLTRTQIEIETPDGSCVRLGSGNRASVKMRVRDDRFYTRLARSGSMGFAEAYMDGDIELGDLPGFITFFLEHRDDLERGDANASIWSRLGNRLLHVQRRNTVRNTRKNIQAHYDLGNEFYKLFLDPTLSYSCALFRQPGESLEQAQKNKLHAIIRKARIQPHHHVLEVGTGWGALAIEIVRQTGCRVTTLTVSQEQYDLARQRVRDAGMARQIDVCLCDYRTHEGSYDRMVSVEMIEAVGHEFLPDFFEQMDRLLKPNGLIVMQAITIPDQRYDAYRKSCDFIQKHIFPGGHLPSLNALGQAMQQHSEWMVESIENIGPHYAPTLRAWRLSFLERVDELRAMGFDEVFIRKWEYYFAYCESAFATRNLNVLHLTLTRPSNADLLAEDANLQNHIPSVEARERAAPVNHPADAV